MPLLRLRILHAHVRLFLAALPFLALMLRRQLRTPAGRRGLARFAFEAAAMFGLCHLIGSLPDVAHLVVGRLATGALIGIHAPRLFARFIWKTK